MVTADLSTSNEKTVVLVTGASGYIALHCVKQLLEDGYTVRGTVRNLQNSAKVSPLRDMKYSAERLELVEADLECAEHWHRNVAVHASVRLLFESVYLRFSAVDGCTYILHIASPWPIVADETTIAVATNGTLNVLRAAAECRTVRKIVLTSSCAAVNDGHKNGARVFDEECWANLESKRMENYGRSKAIAEKAAWNYWNTLPAVPKISLGMVDVRDVARAHIRAMRCPDSDGERILITATPSVWFEQIVEWLHKEFKNQGFVISRVVVPNWLVKLYAKSKLDPHVAAITHRFGPELRFDNTKVVTLYSFENCSITFLVGLKASYCATFISKAGKTAFETEKNVG
ncbi:unnamed protein product [Gongylonema pulchrum]|uniref:Epimerase domain-containing protein n=1 Tax=Gongylonema pulchrum TaxID=637853 RepID=A0A183DYA4_9BILA|nr:unnamed protein product [Gongylonema pulchrum]